VEFSPKDAKESMVIKTILSDFQLLSDPPEIADYLISQKTVEKLFEEKLTESVSLIAQQLRENSDLPKLLEEAHENIRFLVEFNPTVTLTDLEQLQSDALVFRLFENEMAKKYANIIVPNSEERKQFEKSFFVFESLNQQIENQTTTSN